MQSPELGAAAPYLGDSVPGEQQVEQAGDVAAEQVLVVVGDSHVREQPQAGQLHGRVQGIRKDILADSLDIHLKEGERETEPLGLSRPVLNAAFLRETFMSGPPTLVTILAKLPL